MAADDEHDDPLREGVEHLQSAAREVIAATRSLLDAAEELVDDPKAVQGLVGALGSLATAAAGRLRSEGARHRRGPDDDDDGGIQRIRVS
jgi:hypothetical protein